MLRRRRRRHARLDDADDALREHGLLQGVGELLGRRAWVGEVQPRGDVRGARRSLPLARRVEEDGRRLIRGGVRGGERRGVVRILGDGGVETVRGGGDQRDGESRLRGGILEFAGGRHSGSAPPRH